MADELDWNDLRYFLVAARTKSLAGAAREMGVEHTTVGRRLVALERALGAALVLRGPDGLSLTALGEHLAPLAAELERTVSRIREVSSGQGARVRLSVPSGFTRMFTPAFAILREQKPQLSLELSSGATLADLKKGEADLALRVGPVHDQALVARKVGDVGASLYASSHYLERRKVPSDLDDLSGHDLIGYDPSLRASPAAVWIESRARDASIVLRSREMTEMVAAAVSGAGLALLPCILADAEPTLVRLTDTVLVSRPISLVYRREARASEEVRAVMQLAGEVMRKHASALRGTTNTEARSTSSSSK